MKNKVGISLRDQVQRQVRNQVGSQVSSRVARKVLDQVVGQVVGACQITCGHKYTTIFTKETFNEQSYFQRPHVDV